MENRELSIAHIYNAKEVLKSVIRRTDMIHATTLSDGETEVFIKPENLQITGSFKVRGAGYMMSQLSDEEKKRGVIACSAGNHAQGVALAARNLGISATICLPEGAPISKVEATRSFGAEICLVPGVYDDAYQEALRLKEEKGLTFVHPFDDPLVIAGQGTIGLEVIEEMPDIDAIVVPIGGGGLISGVAYAIKQLKPHVKVYGVQAQGAPSMVNSVAQKEKMRLPSVSTIADGIAVKEPGVNTFKYCSELVDGLVTVSEEEICSAILHLLEKYRLVAEGAGAVSIAAVMSGKLPELKGKKAVCVVSGGNVDVNMLNRIISRGLVHGGRRVQVVINLPDKPGQLERVCEAVASQGANILKVHHERNSQVSEVTACALHVTLETRDHEHADAVRKALTDKGFKLIG